MNERLSTRTTSKAAAAAAAAMSSFTAVQDDFTTPDRSKAMAAAAANNGHHGHHRHHNSTEEKKEDLMNSSNTTNDNINSSTSSTLVTPPDSFSTAAANRKENAAAAARAAAASKKKNTNTTSAASSTSTSTIKQGEDNKLVRFDNKNNESAGTETGTTEEVCSVGSADEGESTSSSSPKSTSSKRGLVSRRGRSTSSSSSPGSRSLLLPPPVGAIPSKEAAEAAAAVLEFKTFRSPERKKDDTKDDDENDNSTSCIEDNNNNNSNSVGGSSIHPPSSSLAPRDNTSTKSSGGVALPKKTSTASAYNTSSSKKSTNVTFSPVPLPRISGDKFMKTPTKSPTGGRFTSLPTLDDDALGSPGAIFLSPTRTPTYFHHIDRNATTTTNLKDSAVSAIGSSADSGMNSARAALPLTPRTPKYGAGSVGGVGDPLNGGRLLATPTDFAFDYGKNIGTTTPGSLLDTSNVLAWLHSPTANGLFSPGGLGSMLNTPRAGGTGSILRTPHTPTFSTSFFFSDVAGLPRGDCASPTKSPAKSNIGVAAAAGVGATATNASDPGGKQRSTNNGRGNNNIICISPLSSYHKSKNGPLGPNSPKINYKDMFASPAERSGMAMLGRKAHGGTAGGVQRGGNLDAVHLAERDLMEDEDLSVLLQLASSTPRPAAAVSGGSGISTNDRTAVTLSASTTAADGTTVFRSSSQDGKNGENENLPSLQLPIIGDQAGQAQGTTLTRKIHSRDHNDNMTDDRGIRPIHQTSGGSTVGITNNNNVDNGYKPPTTGSMQHPAQRSAYPMPTHFPPHHESPYYPSLHPAMTHGGSMRVIVGGPPPNRGGKSSGDSSQRVRTYTIGPRGEYPPPPYPPPPSHYPHHHGAHPPPHAHLHPHPHYSRYPPPPPPPHPHSHSQNAHTSRQHMPLYGGALPTKAKKGKKQSMGKTANSGKTGVKRPATTSTPKAPPSAKKAKKPSSQSAPKKKNRSPPLVDKAERLAAAATIEAVNQASGGKNNKAAALAAAILRGVTMRPSGKWQAQLYFAGKSRYIGVFDTREKAALAYEIAREKLKSEKSAEGGGVLSPKRTEAAVNAARKAAFEGVNERDPRLAAK